MAGLWKFKNADLTDGSVVGGGGGGSTGFTHTQSSAAATWTITNTLGRFPRSVQVFISNELVDADIDTPNISTIVITFNSAQSGRAEIN
jgi:hypothetical protein